MMSSMRQPLSGGEIAVYVFLAIMVITPLIMAILHFRAK